MSNHSDNNLEFSLVLASAVHDMKNSLSLLVNAFQQLSKKHPADNEDDKKQQAILEYESCRLNSAMVQLLGLYKLGKQQLPLNLNFHDLEDFLTEQVLQYDHLLKSRNIEVDFDIEEELEGCFDADLIATILSNVLGNVIRYSKSRIQVNAYFDEQLVIEVADDGQGYPEKMIVEQENFIKSINHSTGSTGLGLYFAGQIARFHRKDNIKGNIELSNGGTLGGGVFTLRLP